MGLNLDYKGIPFKIFSTLSIIGASQLIANLLMNECLFVLMILISFFNAVGEGDGIESMLPFKIFFHFTTWNSNIQWTLPGNVSVSRSMIFVDKSLVVLLNSVLLFLQLCLLFRLSMADLGLGFPLPFVWSPWSWLVHSMKKACGRSRQVTPYDTADFKHFYQKLSDFWQAKVTIIWPSAKLTLVPIWVWKPTIFLTSK